MMYRYSCICQEPYFFLSEKIEDCPFCSDGELELVEEHTSLLPENTRDTAFIQEDFQDICIIEENDSSQHSMFHTTYINKKGFPIMGITASKENAVSLAIGLGFSGKATSLLFKKGNGRLSAEDFVTVINRKNGV